MIYLLTDGEFDVTPGGNAAVIKYISERNRDKSVKINTIAFVSQRDEQQNSKEFVEFLKQVAAENGGRFKHVSVNDL